MKFKLLSDIHGDFQFYFQWLHQKEPIDTWTIQLGDFGLGFEKPLDQMYERGIYGWDERNLFIRGNHDSPDICRKQKAYMGDFGYFKDRLFFVSGGWSIDRMHRQAGRDWWPDEELSIPQCEECLKLWEETKPEYVISHDCPDSIKDLIVKPISVKPCRTGLLFDEMLRIHQPKKWIFGHYHVSKKVNVGITDFVALNIKESLKLEI